MASMGIRSLWLQPRLPLAPYGVYVNDRKIEAIVNDIERLSMHATIIETNKDYREYSIAESKIISNMYVNDEVMPFTPAWMFLPKKHYDFVSLGTTLGEYSLYNVVEDYTDLYKGLLLSVKDKSVFQIKLRDENSFEKILFEKILISLGILDVKAFSVPLEHQNSFLFMYEINKKGK